MEISHPRRVLAVSAPNSGLLDLVQGLTGSAPPPVTGNAGDSIAGTTHTYSIKTSYYTASIPIWLDEVSTPSTWAQEFLAPEAREVLKVLGAFIVCFRKPLDETELDAIKKLMESVAEVVRDGCGLAWDGVCLAVGVKQSQTPVLEKSFEEWEEACQQFGFEYVDLEAKGRNEFSEPMGLERLREALEANDWEGADDLDALDPELFDDLEAEDEGDVGFGLDAADRAEMEREMAGMKRDIYGGSIGGEEVEDDDDDEVEKLQAMMLKMQAVRDLGADMPEAERKRFAAKAVNHIMKTL